MRVRLTQEAPMTVTSLGRLRGFISLSIVSSILTTATMRIKPRRRGSWLPPSLAEFKSPYPLHSSAATVGVSRLTVNQCHVLTEVRFLSLELRKNFNGKVAGILPGL